MRSGFLRIKLQRNKFDMVRSAFFGYSKHTLNYRG